MIKIVLDKETQKAIKSIHWEDAQTAQTGLVKRLEKDEIRDWLREEYTFLYDYFYNSMGKLEKEKVKELLFLNRVEMKKLISKWKALGKKDSEEAFPLLLRASGGAVLRGRRIRFREAVPDL